MSLQFLYFSSKIIFCKKKLKKHLHIQIKKCKFVVQTKQVDFFIVKV